MQNFAKTFAKRAAVPITAAAVGATSAQARVSPSVRDPSAPVAVPKLEDEWVLPLVNGNNVVFKPFTEAEINESCAEIVAVFGSRSSAPTVTISEVSPDGSVCSDGSMADNVIEAADDTRRGLGRSQNDQFSALVQLASKMLRRPGVQSELFASMMEDEEVRELMLTQCDSLDSYLTAAGIGSSSALLLPGDVAADAVTIDGENVPSEENGDEGQNFVVGVVGAVSALLQRAGGALAALGGWLQGRLALIMPPPPPSTANADTRAPEGEPSGRKKAGFILGCVTVLMVAIVCMMLVRHPPRTRFRRA